MTGRHQESEGENVTRAAHIRAMQRQLDWLEIQAVRLQIDSPLFHRVIESLREHIRDLESAD